MIEASRRGFLLGLGSLVAAPAIVRVASLMAVRGIVMPVLNRRFLVFYDASRDSVIGRCDVVAGVKLPMPRFGVFPIPSTLQCELEERMAGLVRLAEKLALEGARSSPSNIRQYHVRWTLTPRQIGMLSVSEHHSAVAA